MHSWILIIFGRNVSQKVGTERWYNFPPRLTSVSALRCETGNTKITPFHGMLCVALLTNTSKISPGYRQTILLS